ncbi:tRNA (guanine-N(7)-)-methyltransferase (tRNA(m7G46)-methyltransferase) [Coemansia sp. Benny D115]|nr:tRNA (guanine-N(7)-)-methyltransferase (tRNA(m7G46)-methyltransferase) [Coemansia sp. Benny D115]
MAVVNAWIVEAARQFLVYALLLPVVLGTLTTTLLATNVLISYWFQRRNASKGKLQRTTPAVCPIPRLQFANQLPAHLQSSLVPTEYTSESWQRPQLRLPAGYGELEEELSLVLSLVVRDFVDKWFGEISADVSFPRCVSGQIVQALEVVTERMREVDVAEFVVGTALPFVTEHVRAMRMREQEDHVLSEPSDDRLSNMRWHPALQPLVDAASGQDVEWDQAGAKRAVMGHVRRVVDLMTPLILPADQASFGPHRVLVRELLDGALLTPVVMSMAEPDTINQLLDGQLERLIREQHMVSELRGVLDQQHGQDTSEPLSDNAGRDDEVRTYEQFMLTIDECNDARELERIRDDVVAQIRKRRILIMGQNKDDIVHGQRVGDVIVYVNRLYVAKKKAERRLEEMRAAGSRQAVPWPAAQHRPVGLRKSAASRVSTYYEHRDDPMRLGPPQFTLREILTNVSSLSAFAEYTDLIGSRFLLEFWINVEGIRHQKQADILPHVIASLWKSYFTLRVDELAAAGDEVEEAITRVQRCLKPLRRPGVDVVELDTAGLSPALCSEALQLVFLVQEAVFRHFEASGVFAAFLRSALYTRFLREYYVTPRSAHMEARLFEQDSVGVDARPLAEVDEEEQLHQTEVKAENEEADLHLGTQQEIDELPAPEASSTPASTSSLAPAPRRLSLVRSVAGSLGRRSLSGGSSAASASLASSSPPGTTGGSRRWNFALRSKTDAPLVATTAAVATSGTGSEGLGTRRRERSIAQLAEALDVQKLVPAPSQPLSRAQTTPAVLPEVGVQQASASEPTLLTRRRSVCVGRSEMRRLSASLRSIGLGAGRDGPLVTVDGLQMTSVEAALSSTRESGGDDDESPSSEGEQEAAGDTDDGHVSVASGSVSEGDSSTDEAESLMLARVLTAPTPGDLFLGERVAQLSSEIARKTHQMAIVRALMRQAQMRRRTNEQRILRASYRALRREVHEAEEQHRLFAQALDDHVLASERTRVHIPRAISRVEEGEGKEPHVTYLIEVQQSLPAHYGGARAGGRMHAPTGWVVARRYREFFALHQELRALAAAVDARRRPALHELPARTPLMRLQRDRDIELRRTGLEKYLRALLADPLLCASRPLRLFLSTAAPPSASNRADVAEDDSSAGWMARIHKTVGEDIDGVTGAESMLELIVQELGAQVAMQHDRQPAVQPAGSAALFVDPLSDLFVEIFGLKNRRNWLRRQAISILLRHIVGGAVEQRIRNLVGSLTGGPALAQILANLRGTLWPAAHEHTGKGLAYAPFQGFRARTDEQKAECARKARAQILLYVPRVLGSMVGKRNAREGARVAIDAVQKEMPNLNLVLHLFDALVGSLFPEIKYQLD